VDANSARDTLSTGCLMDLFQARAMKKNG